MVVLVLPISLLPPSQILPGSLSPLVRPFPLFFLCLLSVRVIQLAPPPQQLLIPRRPSGGLLWQTPPVDADQMPGPGFRRPEMLMCFLPMRMLVLGLGVGWRA